MSVLIRHVNDNEEDFYSYETPALQTSQQRFC